MNNSRYQLIYYWWLINTTLPQLLIYLLERLS